MKTKSLLLAASLFALVLSSCGSDDKKEDPGIEVSGISVDQETLSIEVESTSTIVATLQPAGASGDISWSSSDPSVAAVNNGVVTALKTGEATVVASHGVFTSTCEITVSPKTIDPEDLPASLKGSNYTIIQIDEISFSAIQSKVINDVRPDDTNKFLYVWDETLTYGTSTGLNFFGQSEGWVSLIVGGAGWSGAGYFVDANYPQIDMTDMYNNPDDYVFHIGLKSTQPTSSYLFIFNDGTSEAKICVGSNNYDDGGVIFEPYADFTRDGEWHSVEIPASKLRELGVFYNNPFNDVNVFAFLAGGVQGTTLDYDAAFFYKKAE
ncbi:Ig domain-containing protein [Labilibacter sediminis]|nr:Ig domain-containing protein [Labilibacter sediminis]